MNYPISRQHKMENKQLSDARIDHQPQRSPSPVDQMLTKFNDEIEGLTNALDQLETRLCVICNDRPRPSKEEIIESVSTELSGDSHLVSQMNSIGVGLCFQKDRIWTLLDKLDV